MASKYKAILLSLCFVTMLSSIGCNGSTSPEPTPIKGMAPGEYRDSFDAKPTVGKSTKPARPKR